MPRRWKNSDDRTYYTDKSTDSRLERLRCDLIKDYARKKYNKNNNNTKRQNNYNKRKGE